MRGALIGLYDRPWPIQRQRQHWRLSRELSAASRRATGRLQDAPACPSADARNYHRSPNTAVRKRAARHAAQRRRLGVLAEEYPATKSQPRYDGWPGRRGHRPGFDDRAGHARSVRARDQRAGGHPPNKSRECPPMLPHLSRSRQNRPASPSGDGRLAHRHTQHKWFLRTP